MRWYVVEIRGNAAVVLDRPFMPRPPGANPSDPDPFTPWFNLADHIHTPDKHGCLGAHVKAKTPSGAQTTAVMMLVHAGRLTPAQGTAILMNR